MRDIWLKRQKIMIFVKSFIFKYKLGFWLEISKKEIKIKKNMKDHLLF